MPVELTPDQQKALDAIIAFIRTPIKKESDVAGILYAAAGCGKTFLTRVIVNNVRGTHRIAGVAPTHKARKVLDGFLNKDSLIKVKTMTIASLLNKLRVHSYIGTKRYENGADSKMHLFDLFIIDEASMITDGDVTLITTFAFQLRKKVLFVGDKFQIPNPSQKYICMDGFAYKKDSIAFELPTERKFELTTNMRQAENNPIVNLYNEFRDAIAERREPTHERKSKMNGELGVRFYTDQEKWYKQMEKIYLNLQEPIHNVRIIAYTNDTVKNHNLAVRRFFKRGAKPEVGELLMGYGNIGWPVHFLENSQDYYITHIKHTETHYISLERGTAFNNLVGDFLTLKETDTDVSSVFFMPDLNDAANQGMLKELIARAQKVNLKKSTKDDFKRYCLLKNQLLFMENIYHYNGEVVGEGEFKVHHPLLFKSTAETIAETDGDRTIMDHKLSQDITALYGDILSERISDDKPLSVSEKICDQFCAVEKDVDYGVCITSHKSQGSNFKIVFVDEADFDKLHNTWSFTLDCKIDATKERNQLKYVAFTRPTHAAYVYYRK